MEGLLVNPRLPADVKEALSEAWHYFAEIHPQIFGRSAIGVLTSGSTSGGVGSIIVLSRKALEVSALAVNRRLRATGKDVWGLALPVFHVGGFSIPLRAALSHSQVAEFEDAWDATKFHSWLRRERVTLLSLVPTQLYDLVETGLEAPSELRAIVVGGGRLDRALHDRAVAKGWPVLQSYGMTECCSQVATALPGSDGLILETLDHVEVRVDLDNRLSIRSQALLSARISFDPAMQATLEFPVKDDGWFQTSDRVHIEKIALSDGLHHHLTVLGRDGEVVKVLGELVDLSRVRSAIEEITGEDSKLNQFRQKTWVIALPDARRGHELVLVIEGAAQVLPAVWSQYLNARLAPFEIPSRTVFVEMIPRSALGKVLSTLLADQIARGEFKS